MLSVILIPTFTLTIFFFFFNDTATTEIYTLSLHDALPISPKRLPQRCNARVVSRTKTRAMLLSIGDRKSTRLNSSHLVISYAVFCLKKKNNNSVSDIHHDEEPNLNLID